MAYCIHCGAALVASMRFCGNCGEPVNVSPSEYAAPATAPAAVPDAPYPSGPPSAPPETQAPPARPNLTPGQAPDRTAEQTGSSWAPPPAVVPTPGPIAGTTPGFDTQRVLSVVLYGNWVVALSVALTAVLVSGLLATVLGLVAKPADIGVDNTLTFIAVLMTSAFGADLVVHSASGTFDGGASVGLFPFTITICTLATTVVVFRRATVSYSRALDAIADGMRAAVLAAVPMTAIALIFRADNDKFGSTSLRYWESSGRRDLLEIGSSAVGTFFLTILILSVVLAVSSLGRRDWWGPRVAKAHDWFAAPLAGCAALTLLLPVAGAIGVAAILLFGEDNTDGLSTDGWMTLIGLSVAYLANIGFGVMVLGSGGRLGVQAQGSGRIGGSRSRDSYEEFHRLTWFTSDAPQPHEPGLWVSLVVVPVVLLLAVLIVARRSGRREAILGNVLRFVAGLLVGIPLLVRLCSMHASADVNSKGRDVIDGLIDGSARGSAFVGAAGVDTTFELALYALAVGLFIAGVTGAIDVNKLRGHAGQVARTMTAPAAPGATHGPTTGPDQQAHVSQPPYPRQPSWQPNQRLDSAPPSEESGTDVGQTQHWPPRDHDVPEQR